MRIIVCRERECARKADPGCVATTDEPEVPTMSPARLLAASLTDPDTRGEWKRTGWSDDMALGMYSIFSTSYENESRDLSITRSWSACSKTSVSTPFTLTKAEQKIVEDATYAFDEWLRAESEKDALARLVAPKAHTGGASNATSNA